ncbi:MAG: glycosyltransferase family 4 protein [Clostridia bacterium]|nr:glycosyltransferase family 4 protein [Clostridia bacterium]
MKIVVLANFAMGLYKFRKELIEELCKDNEVYIVLPDGEFIEELKKIGCKFIPFEFNRRGINPIADFNQIIRYKKILKSLKPDVVLSYTIKPNVYGGIASSSLKIPYIANVTGLGTSIENGGLLGFISTTLYKIGLKKASCVFFQNENNKKLFEDKKIVSGKTRLIPGSGVNLSNHNLEEYESDAEGIRFLFIGRIMKDKGIGELLDAFDVISAKYPNVSLDIVGGCDEDYSAVLEEKAESGFITYHGQQKQVHEFIKNSHCTVLPSYHEGLANVLLESASTGRPVIASRVPGCIETFDEGITGFGCEVKSYESLAKAMEKFIVLSLDEKKQMGLNGRKKVEKEFDRSIVIDAYIDEINNIKKPI